MVRSVGAAAVILIASLLGLQAKANGLPLKLIGHGGPIKSITVSPDGKRALTASFDYSIIYWDLSGETGHIRHRLIGHDSAVNDVEFVPGTQRAVSASDDGSLGIWDLTTGKLVARLQSDIFKTLDVAVSPNGNHAAVARWDGTARVYDLKAQTEIALLKGHRGNVNAVAFSADGKRLYSAAYDGQILEWDIAESRLLRPIYRHGWGVNSIARIDDDRLVFGALDGTAGVVSIKGAEKIADLAKRDRPIQSVKVSADARQIGVSDGRGRIEVFGSSDLKMLEESEVAYGPVWDFDFVAGSSQLYHVGLDDFAIRWQVSPREFSKVESKFPRRFQVRTSDDPGELEFRRKCSVCHTLTPDGANRAGPTLFAVFGRKAGTLPGYTYSKALLDSQVVWNAQTIARLFDDGPDVMVPGTKMPIQRLKSVQRRDDLIEYLRRATAPQQ
ncbi:MAG: c-type cytochrome [Rhizobiaceae bacterium]